MVPGASLRLSRGAASRLIGAALAIACSTPAGAELDLKRAEVSHLANGLTVILLEDHSLPMVSAQMLYKSGSRDETAGKTGLAHFLEHLAFRGSANFPNAGATEAIYDAGGEWHGYTWIDQTTYYSTMPSGGLDLLLRIEADRMERVTIDPASIDAEKGAVITEMHSYENDPASVLLDAVIATAFQAHPYRSNSIGYESDVSGLTPDDARAFYETHYSPANGVLAIAGDFDPAEAKTLIGREFGSLAARPAPARVAASEPPQRGVRRIDLLGTVDRQYFEIAWPAPAASNADFPAFLVLQGILSGGSGVNFRQNEWGTPSRSGAVLDGATEDLRSWFIPTADRYIFTVKGSIPRVSPREALERTLEKRINAFRSQAPTTLQLAAAKRAIAEELGDDVGSTEDAAHQLAFFEGIGALDMLLSLPDRVAAVTAADVQRVARAYLVPEFRTIGWYGPGNPTSPTALGAAARQPAGDRPGIAPHSAARSQPELFRLKSGLPMIIRANASSPSATVELLTSRPIEGESPRDLPGLGVIRRSGPADQLAANLALVHQTLATELLSRKRSTEPPSGDPETRLQQMMGEQIGVKPASALRPIALVISGAVNEMAALRLSEQRFGNVKPGPVPVHGTSQVAGQRIVVTIDEPRSQGALGYIVAAPLPATRQGLAWRMLLYILTHDYSGRLGRSAITDKGLAYHIYSSYRTDGSQGWATIWTGVDPDRADALEAEFRNQLARLVSEPPTPAEVDAARQHLLGRDLSGAQTNDEIADKLVRTFVETGGLRTHDQLKAMLDAVTPDEVRAAALGFSKGSILRVDVARP